MKLASMVWTHRLHFPWNDHQDKRYNQEISCSCHECCKFFPEMYSQHEILKKKSENLFSIYLRKSLIFHQHVVSVTSCRTHCSSMWHKNVYKICLPVVIFTIYYYNNKCKQIFPSTAIGKHRASLYMNTSCSFLFHPLKP